MPDSVKVGEELERLHRELLRLRAEGERLRTELGRRPTVRQEPDESTRAGASACDLLCAIQAALISAGKNGFFSEYRTKPGDLLMLVALCEDDAARAGPLIDLRTRWFANTIRKLLV